MIRLQYANKTLGSQILTFGEDSQFLGNSSSAALRMSFFNIFNISQIFTRCIVSEVSPGEEVTNLTVSRLRLRDGCWVSSLDGLFQLILL